MSESARLRARLAEGWARMDAAQRAGKDIAALEDWFLILLDLYERQTDRERQGGDDATGEVG